MAKLTEAEKIARYDAERDGSLYIKPGADTVWGPILDIVDDPTNDGRAHDTPLSDDEEKAIDILLALPVTRSRDARHREERLLAILEQIAEMPEPEQTKAIRFMEQVIEAAAARR